MYNRYTPSKTGLFLMELILAILFFSLSAGFCVQLFVRAHILSNESVVLNHSILWAQNMAETFYGCNGDVDEIMELLNTDNNGTQTDSGEVTTLSFLYKEDFTPISLSQSHFPTGGYELTADIKENDTLITCHILVQEFYDGSEPALIYELNVSLFPNKEVSRNAQ